jgi:ribosome biogenesis GTPase
MPGPDTSHPHSLADLGFDGSRVDEAVAAGIEPGSAARVVRMDRGWATLQDVAGTRRVRLRECPPIVVGDWLGQGADGTLVRLSRRSLLVRRAADKDEPQQMAANVDVVVVTWALDTRVSTGRLRDMLVLARESGAVPVLALSKVDIAESVDGLLAELDGVLDDVEVVTTSAVTGEGMDRLQAIATGRTIVLLGSSGAGKSTLTNALLGSAVQDTGAVREHDGRGMHTTTARSLHLLPGGACVIDTPGLRTLRPDVDEATLAASFDDVETLSAQCRFRDCRHRAEPGCAVRDGVDPDRLRNFQKLLRETRRDTLSYTERRQQVSAWKSRGKEARVRMKMKRGEP